MSEIKVAIETTIARFKVSFCFAVTITSQSYYVEREQNVRNYAKTQ